MGAAQPSLGAAAPAPKHPHEEPARAASDGNPTVEVAKITLSGYLSEVIGGLFIENR